MFVIEIEMRAPRARIAEELGQHHAVLVRGGADPWPARGKYSLAFFGERCGDARVLVRGGRFGYRVFGLAKMSEFIDYVEGKSALIGGTKPIHDAVQAHRARDRIRVYAVYSLLLKTYPELIEDVCFTDFLPAGSRMEEPTWWIGGSGCETPFHWDLNSNIFAQMVGSKVFELAQHTRSINARMKPSRYFEAGSTYSSVDFSALPDSASYLPEIASVTLHPGDVLILPPRMWHQVVSLTPSVSVQAFFDPVSDLRQAFGRLVIHYKWIVHLAGLFCRDNCVCHASPDQVELARSAPMSRTERIAMRIGKLGAHRRELADEAGWYEQTPAAAESARKVA